MRVRNAEQVTAVRGSLNKHFEADIYYDGDLRLADVPIDDVQFKEDGNAAIQQSGSGTVVWTDRWARSISPKQIGDVLAPFGPLIYLYSVISLGKRVLARTLLGQFVITNVPSALDEEMVFRGELITLGSTVKLEFKELSAKMDRDRFDVPTAPTILSSVWDEVGRVTSMQLTRSIPDAAISRAVMYQENRLDAIADLLDILDGVPHITSDGTLSARPNEWPDAVDVIEAGDGGSLVSIGNAMTSTATYNRVAFRGKSGDQQIILASAEVTDGPLRARNPDGSPSPFGRVTRFVSSDYITTAGQAQEYVNRELPRTAQLGMIILPVVEHFNAFRERGDVVRLRPRSGERIGRVLSITRSSGSDTQSLTVEVQGG